MGKGGAGGRGKWRSWRYRAGRSWRYRVGEKLEVQEGRGEKK
jgi:hypothetical protein